MKSKLNRIIKEVNLWTYAAVSLPLIGLCALFFFKFIGFDIWYERALVTGAVIFFIVAVIWWWWAIAKIAFFAEMLSEVSNKFTEVKKDVSKLRDDL